MDRHCVLGRLLRGSSHLHPSGLVHVYVGDTEKKRQVERSLSICVVLRTAAMEKLLRGSSRSHPSQDVVNTDKNHWDAIQSGR